MQTVKMISTGVMPVLFIAIIGYGLFRKINVFDAFLDGAMEGLKTAGKILPALVGLIAAITMFRVSGAMELITRFLSPITSRLGVPAEVLPLALLRPISGSGALAVVSDLFRVHGPDSIVGRIASVMMGSTETTFYTLAVYYGSVGIKDARFTVKAALLADLTGMLASVWACRLFYGLI